MAENERCIFCDTGFQIYGFKFKNKPICDDCFIELCEINRTKNRGD